MPKTSTVKSSPQHSGDKKAKTIGKKRIYEKVEGKISPSVRDAHLKSGYIDVFAEKGKLKPSDTGQTLPPSDTLTDNTKLTISFTETDTIADIEDNVSRLCSAARKFSGKTQARFGADMGGVDSANVRRIESGRVTPSLPTLKKIADASGLTIEISLKPK